MFQRLGFADFRRAKSVCSSWHSASRQSVPKRNQFPMLILFPEKEKNDNNSCCTLFNLEEKDKLYKVKDLGLDFAKSDYVATYGNWLLMLDPLYNPYIVNLFTKERINLPPLEPPRTQPRIRTTMPRIRTTSDVQLYHNQRKYKGLSILDPVFWVDEITKDYLVVWGFSRWCCLVYAKKGDDLWTQIPDTLECSNPVYMHHKLYFFRRRDFKIFDFSGEMLPQTFRLSMDMLSHIVGLIDKTWRFFGEKMSSQ